MAGKTQMQMCQEAIAKTLAPYQHFAEVQASGNPLTKAEVEQLADRVGKVPRVRRLATL